MGTVAVGGKPAGKVEPVLSAGNDVQHGRRQQPAQNLDHNVGEEFLCRKSTRTPQADRDGGVEVATRNVADGIGHRQDGQSEGQRHTE